MRHYFTIGAVTVFLTLAGCNTVSGAGKDVSSAGKAVERTADGAK
ncbi:entericidin A/B family lipoprotein [Sphingomonas quercus]|uniref:Entericidin A/B family lipoprotein n=1 Tax=Sphingomonas quercus TaxID=2842451 RepID=A0ABS6BJ70_9SPHN|nr:entericidin A/B family lipoprotein [Sphingomonas quercus]MBU3077662.1 entericidin A/B family lipoprotein [Sphingomonas quercus]